MKNQTGRVQVLRQVECRCLIRWRGSVEPGSGVVDPESPGFDPGREMLTRKLRSCQRTTETLNWVMNIFVKWKLTQNGVKIHAHSRESQLLMKFIIQ